MTFTDPFTALDGARRAAGTVLDALDLGPVRLPSDVVWTRSPARLHSFPASAQGPVVLLVPAPFKRAYIWDLEPSGSVVRALVEAGCRVHLLEWTDPGAGDERVGLDEVVGGLLRDAVAAVRSATGEDPVLLGHSLGGTFAALFAARHPRAVRGLVTLEAPLRFGPDAGAFAPAVAASPHARSLTAAFGNVPGSFVSLASAAAAPVTFHLGRSVDLVASLWDPRLRTHMRVERWTLDELAMPARLFEDVVEALYRRDEFTIGELVVDGERIGPEMVTCPLLTVVNPASTIVPPRSILPFHEAASSASKTLLRYGGDRGVALQHVGVLVGRNAHASLWPDVVRWLHATRR